MAGVSLSVRIELGLDARGLWISRYEEVADAGWDDVAAAVGRVDGLTCNEVAIERPVSVDGSRESMIVGGGADDRLNVGYVWLAPNLRHHYWFLTDPGRGETLETRTIGGQGTPLPARMWVSRAAALAAVRHFVLRGGRDPGLSWAPDIVD